VTGGRAVIPGVLACTARTVRLAGTPECRFATLATELRPFNVDTPFEGRGAAGERGRYAECDRQQWQLTRGELQRTMHTAKHCRLRAGLARPGALERSVPAVSPATNASLR
jgi:hypothetical protein